MTQLARTHDDSLPPLTLGPISDPATGEAYTLVSADLSIRLNTGVSLPLSGAPVVDATAQTVSYTFDAAEIATLLTDTPRLDCIAEWEITVSGAVVVDRTQYFDVVDLEIITDVNDDELVSLLPELDGRRIRERGAATGGTTTSLIDVDHLPKWGPNYWAGSQVRMLTGGNKGAIRTVTLFNKATATLTVSPAFTYAPAAGDAYELIGSFNPWVRQAWLDIYHRTVNFLGRDKSARLRDGVDFRQAHISLALSKVCAALYSSENDSLKTKMTEFRADYQAAMDAALIKVDDGSGEIETTAVAVYWGK